MARSPPKHNYSPAPRSSTLTGKVTEAAARFEANATPIRGPEDVHIMGNLSLPCLNTSEFSASSELRQKVEQLLPELDMISSRDLTALSGRIDVNTAFEQFIVDEALAWNQSGREPDKGCNFVRASGSLDAPLAHYLHQPSLTSLRCRGCIVPRPRTGLWPLLLDITYLDPLYGIEPFGTVPRLDIIDCLLG
ncbi:MAG: hypothetical protein Q9227_005872 [Pyrenula ochraceoflavens]